MNDERDVAKSKLKSILIGHVGRPRAIGMGELFTETYNCDWKHRINDTRKLRVLITELREEGLPICSDRQVGYWIAAAGSELDDFCRRLRGEGLGKLVIEAKIRKLSLPELIGQIKMNLE